MVHSTGNQEHGRQLYNTANREDHEEALLRLLHCAQHTQQMAGASSALTYIEYLLCVSGTELSTVTMCSL